MSHNTYFVQLYLFLYQTLALQIVFFGVFKDVNLISA